MMPLEIAPKIYDVGVVDWAVRDFHGYKTERGASYNSYLIMDEKICLIDTVKAMFAEELLAKIERVVDPGKIDYVIVTMWNRIMQGHFRRWSKRLRMLSFLLQLKGRRKQFVIMVIYMIFRS